MGVVCSHSSYQDRGMMKWAAFATEELTEAQKKFREEQKGDKNDNPNYKKTVVHLVEMLKHG